MRLRAVCPILLLAVSALAQQGAPARPAAYRLDFTLTESQSGQAVSTRHFAMLLTEANGSVDSGERVPVKSGDGVTYQQVGVQLHCSIRNQRDTPIHDIFLTTNVDISTVLANAAPGAPTLSHAHASQAANVPLGRPVSLVRFDAGKAGDVYQLSVQADPAASAVPQQP